MKSDKIEDLLNNSKDLQRYLKNKYSKGLIRLRDIRAFIERHHPKMRVPHGT